MYRSLVRRVVTAASIFSIVFSFLAGESLVAQNAAVDEMDRSVKPGDDFYRYASGGWLKKSVIPAGKASYDDRALIGAITSQRVHDLIEEAFASNPTKGGIPQKIGDYYASVMDETGIEAKGMMPIAREIARISAIKDKVSLSAYLGSILNSEVNGLTANADHIFGVWINQGFEDSKHNLPHLWQGGLGMTDHEIYLDASPRSNELRSKYQAHIAAVLNLAGIPDSENKAATIFALETRIARSHASDPDAAAASLMPRGASW